MWDIIAKAIALKSGFQINWLVINNFSWVFLSIVDGQVLFLIQIKQLKLQFTKNTVYMIFKGDVL